MLTVFYRSDSGLECGMNANAVLAGMGESGPGVYVQCSGSVTFIPADQLVRIDYAAPTTSTICALCDAPLAMSPMSYAYGIRP